VELQTVAYPRALRDVIAHEMRRDEQVVVIGPCLAGSGPGTGDVEGMLEEFGPLRVRDTTGATSSLIQLGLRASRMGDVPLLRYPDAMALAAELVALLEHAAQLQDLLAADPPRAMLIKATIPARAQRPIRRMTAMLEQICAGLPGIRVVAASDATTASGLIRSALRGDQVVIFFDHELFYSRTEPIPSGTEHLWPLHSPRLLRLGRDLHLVGYGLSTTAALDAAESLARQEETEAGVIDLVSLNPLPLRKVERWAADSERVLILEHGAFRGGIGAELAFALAQRHPHWVIRRLSLPNGPEERTYRKRSDFVAGLARWIHAAASDMLTAFPARTEWSQGRTITTARRRRPACQVLAS